MASKIKVDALETADGTGTIALSNQFTGMTTSSLPALGGAQMPTGSVLQVVQVTGSTGSTTTSSTVAVVGDAGTITPSSTSSKILVTITGTVRFGSNNAGVLAIWRDVAGAGYSEVQSFSRHTVYQSHSTGNAEQGQFVSMSYLDSPNTTSACNYKAAINSWTAGQTTYWLPNPSHQDQTTIIMMEIAG